jgi:mannose-6-phosphate isomerase-like protein (cupin superfamily)
MDLVKRIAENIGVREDKFYKTSLFESSRLLLGLNCLEPGQVQQPHIHGDQDKFYYVLEGSGQFWLGQDRLHVGVGQIVWAPAGLSHGVENNSDGRLSLLVGIAPAP